MELTQEYLIENAILPEDSERITKGLALGWSEPSRNTLSGRLAGREPKSGIIDVWPEFGPLPKLRRVQWGDSPLSIHLTESKMLYGGTLCEKSFPMKKGVCSPNKFCRRCMNVAVRMGFRKGFTKGLESVPTRIQRQRTKGWRMPENAVYVGRPSKWGNPVKSPWPKPNAAQRLLIVARFEEWFLDYLDFLPEARQTLNDELRGKDLACWCPLNQPCHADALLRLANA